MSDLRRIFIVGIFIVSILAAGGVFAQTRAKTPTAPPVARLSLEDYLAQVSSRHTGVRAADLAAKGAKASSEEGKLLYRPTLFGGASASVLGTANPLSDSEAFQSRVYSLGLSQNVGIGMTAKLTHNRNETIARSSALSGQYFANWNQLDVNQSLWRGWAGRELDAQADAIEYGQLANSYQQSYISKALLLEAESYYWRLALAREVVVMQKDALDRAQRTASWAGRRARLQLSDRAEALQSDGALQARRLDLQTAEDEVTAAAQAFNASRGVTSNVVPEALIDIRPIANSMQIPERVMSRDDVRAAQMQAKASAANAQLARERNKPTVDLYASVPLNKPDDPSGALAASIPVTSRVGTTVGVRATIPLDFATEARIREGYNAQASAADATFERKAFDEQRDWADLTTKFTQAKQRLQLYEELEKTQREKLLYERDRQTRGRTTLQSVLIYEGDYQFAQLGRIRTLAELLTLNAQMKLYGVSNESR